MFFELKQPLRNCKAENNADRDSAGDFKGLYSFCSKHLHIVHDKIVRGIVNPGSGYQSKNSGDKIQRHRIFAYSGKNPGYNRQKKGCKQGCKNNTGTEFTEDQIADPAQCACERAVKKLVFWHTEQHGKGCACRHGKQKL